MLISCSDITIRLIVISTLVVLYRFSRGIVFWGGPLEERNETGKEDDEATEDLKKGERDKRKE